MSLGCIKRRCSDVGMTSLCQVGTCWKSIKKLETFDSIYFRGKSHFGDDGTQNYLVFQPIYKYFEITPTTNIILSWKSKGLSDEAIKIKLCW